MIEHLEDDNFMIKMNTVDEHTIKSRDYRFRKTETDLDK
jgi:hypothetical protein